LGPPPEIESGKGLACGKIVVSGNYFKHGPENKKGNKSAQKWHGCILARSLWRSRLGGGFPQRLAARPHGGAAFARGGTPPEPAGEDADATILPHWVKNRVQMRRAKKLQNIFLF
jgi:hypothetical protein